MILKPHVDGPLISVDELAGIVDTPDVAVCDVRWYLADPSRGRSEYVDAHVPGAVFVDLETQLSARRGPGRHPLPDPVRFAATLGRLGIEPGTSGSRTLRQRSMRPLPAKAPRGTSTRFIASMNCEKPLHAMRLAMALPKPPSIVSL